MQTLTVHGHIQDSDDREPEPLKLLLFQTEDGQQLNAQLISANTGRALGRLMRASLNIAVGDVVTVEATLCISGVEHITVPAAPENDKDPVL